MDRQSRKRVSIKDEGFFPYHNIQEAHEDDSVDVALVAAAIALVLAGVVNNMSGSMMSYVMPAFPAWLLYFTTIMYTVGFFVIALILGERPFSREILAWSSFRHILWLAFFTAVNGLAFQFSAAWVDGDFSQILTSLSLPQVTLFRYLLLPAQRCADRQLWCGFSCAKRTLRHCGLALVFMGILVGSIPSIHRLIMGHTGEASNLWYMVILFILMTTFDAFQQVHQDKAFRDPTAYLPPMSCLAWYNLISLPFYLLTIPLEAVPYLNGTTHSTSVSYALQNQREAFLCFQLHPSQDVIDTSGCQMNVNVFWGHIGPLLWPLLFTFGYIGLFSTNAYLIKRKGVLFPNVVGAVIQLLAAVLFMSPGLVGQAYSVPFNWLPIVGCLIIGVGIWLRGKPEESRSYVFL
eukprot:TRINITY_DN204_c0_g1_i3.p1 TRINITY_DN204_c0_g1~~TRINITY_DN204_c0_g1_i3.p1  ORF type:complete len:405 (-),score=85.26 TRINITY_DN204_c0_g1_i3:862-2076(-)